MTLIQSIILGTIQGLTEFIPISSSGHLVLIRELMGWEDPGVVFDIILHLGTLLAVIIYFRKDWIDILTSLSKKNESRKTLGNIIIATIPTFFVGYFFHEFINNIFRDILWVAAFLIITGFILLTADKYSTIKIEKKDISKVNWKDALLIGIAQVVSLLPGVSRSGITISTGLFRKLRRTEATRFSFLMATIAITGTSIFGALNLIKNNHLNGYFAEIVVGFIFSFLVGYLSIKYLMNFLKNHKFSIFAAYLISLGLIIIGFAWII